MLQKNKYLENKKNFLDEIKKKIIVFEGLIKKLIKKVDQFGQMVECSFKN